MEKYMSTVDHMGASCIIYGCCSLFAFTSSVFVIDLSYAFGVKITTYDTQMSKIYRCLGPVSKRAQHISVVKLVYVKKFRIMSDA